MFKTCKEQYERKIAKGKLTKEYAEKQKRYVGKTCESFAPSADME